MNEYVSWLGKHAVLFNPMTKDEQREYDYRMQERLGVLCCADEPTPEQLAIAESEAQYHLRESRLDEARLV